MKEIVNGEDLERIVQDLLDKKDIKKNEVVAGIDIVEIHATNVNTVSTVSKVENWGRGLLRRGRGLRLKIPRPFRDAAL